MTTIPMTTHRQGTGAIIISIWLSDKRVYRICGDRPEEAPEVIARDTARWLKKGQQ